MLRILLCLASIPERTTISGRSDALMILSIDRVHNKIKLTSIARDTYVTVDGYGQTKINHAYAYEALNWPLKQLMKRNFDMNIQGFVTVNFSQLAEIIDYLGGINIAVTEEEREVANRLIQELGVQCRPITESGESVHLTGDQAVILPETAIQAATQRERAVSAKGAVRYV